MDMDNAANGLRGRRATPSPELFNVLRDRYGIEAAGSAIDLGGSANLNLLVGDDRWVVRVYRPYVTAPRLAELNLARRELALGSVPCSEILPTREGKPWTIVSGRLVEVERYVESDANMDSWGRLEAGLPLLGRIHTLLSGVKVSSTGRQSLFANHVEPQEALDWTLRGTQRIRAWDASAAELQLAKLSEELAHLVSVAEREIVAALPRQLVHGDFWDNNVLFRNARVVLATDFDFMGERARIDDLALTLYYTNSTFSEDPLSDDRIRRLRLLIDAYDSGLNDPLSNLERAALPLAIARQPLWSVGKWMALLDAEETARRLAAEISPDVTWALQIVRDLDRWQDAFA